MLDLRAEIDNQTVTVGFFNGVYPRFGDSVGKLIQIFGQQSWFLTRYSDAICKEMVAV